MASLSTAGETLFTELLSEYRVEAYLVALPLFRVVRLFTALTVIKLSNIFEYENLARLIYNEI